MSKITNDGSTQSGTGCFIAVAYQYGNSGRQRVNACYSFLMIGHTWSVSLNHRVRPAFPAELGNYLTEYCHVSLSTAVPVTMIGSVNFVTSGS